MDRVKPKRNMTYDRVPVARWGRGKEPKILSIFNKTRVFQATPRIPFTIHAMCLFFGEVLNSSTLEHKDRAHKKTKIFVLIIEKSLVCVLVKMRFRGVARKTGLHEKNGEVNKRIRVLREYNKDKQVYMG